MPSPTRNDLSEGRRGDRDYRAAGLHSEGSHHDACVRGKGQDAPTPLLR
jgi:hypothetical protein